MDRPDSTSSVRRYVAYVGLFGTSQLHLRNPFVVAGWSLAFPGLGHLLLSKYIRGYLLFLWEIFVNVNAHINLAILYSFTGRFEMAKDILDINWVMLYIPTYIFAVMHSADGLSLLDLPIILAAVFCLFASIYGFLLTWGPILWGIIGIVVGFGLGLIIKLIITKKHTYNRQKNPKASEVVLIIECVATQVEMVKDLLWEHHALGVRKLDLESNE